MQCPGCGTIWKDGYTFCAFCGSELRPTPRAGERRSDAAVLPRRCPRCDRLLPPHYRFCDFCGSEAPGGASAPLSPPPPVKAARDEDEDIKVYVPASGAVKAAERPAPTHAAGVRMVAAGVIQKKNSPVEHLVNASDVAEILHADDSEDREAFALGADDTAAIQPDAPALTDAACEAPEDTDDYIEPEDECGYDDGSEDDDGEYCGDDDRYYGDDDGSYDDVEDYDENDYSDSDDASDEEYVEAGYDSPDEDCGEPADDCSVSQNDEYSEDGGELDLLGRQVHLLDYDELVNGGRRPIGIHNPRLSNEEIEQEYELRYRKRKRDNARYIFIWFIGFLMTTAAIFLPVFERGGGIIPTHYDNTLGKAISTLAADQLTDVWALTLELATLLPGVAVLLFVPFKKRLVCLLSLLLSLAIMLAAAIAYAVEYGVGAVLSFSSGSVQLGYWAVLLLLVITLLLCPKKEKLK